MEVITTEERPIKLWAPTKVDYADAVIQQFRNLANLPIVFKYVCGMPDYHLGYGMPIGGVLATRGGVVPNAVGVDIGCGMIAMRTQIDADTLTRDVLQRLRLAIHERVPVGMTHHAQRQSWPKRLEELPGPVVVGQVERAKYQIGTLGGGNHFIELQRDAERRLWIMLHSGSRNVGKRVCDHYQKTAKAGMKRYHTMIPDMDLAFLPAGTSDYEAYLWEMNWCLAFAEESRAAMMSAVCEAFEQVVGVALIDEEVIDTHHNYAAMEHHFGENVLVHRKGAVKATGRVTIPGSMGTPSIIGQGLEPAESFNTCSHGAGRRMGRKEANRTIKHEEAVAMMADVVYGVREGEYDEMPSAYKDLDAVMAAQTDLVRPVRRLMPMAVVKG